LQADYPCGRFNKSKAGVVKKQGQGMGKSAVNHLKNIIDLAKSLVNSAKSIVNPPKSIVNHTKIFCHAGLFYN